MTASLSHGDTPLPLDYYQRRYNISRTTMWRYRRAGLPAIGVGAKTFVRESDFVRFLERMNGQTARAVPCRSDNQPNP